MTRVAIPAQAILTEIHETNQDSVNPFENAQKEEEKIADYLLKKQQKLDNFKKLVKQRVNAYVNIQKKVNEDQQLAVIKTTKSKNQVKIITSSNGRATIQRVVSNYQLNDAKKDLASKSKNEENEETPLPGGDWTKNTQEDENQSLRSLQRRCKSATSSLSSLPDFVLRSLIDKNENEANLNREYKQRIHSTRKIFADLEREKVKNDLSNKKENKSLVVKIKLEKEKEREKHEKDIQAQNKLQTLKDMFVKKIDEKPKIITPTETEEAKQARKQKEFQRYIEAIKELIREKAHKKGFILPPLCQCNIISNNSWDFNPNNCANNCIFYKNPKEYARALQCLLASNDLV